MQEQLCTIYVYAQSFYFFFYNTIELCFFQFFPPYSCCIIFDVHDKNEFNYVCDGMIRLKLSGKCVIRLKSDVKKTFPHRSSSWDQTEDDNIDRDNFYWLIAGSA